MKELDGRLLSCQFKNVVSEQHHSATREILNQREGGDNYFGGVAVISHRTRGDGRRAEAVRTTTIQGIEEVQGRLPLKEEEFGLHVEVAQEEASGLTQWEEARGVVTDLKEVVRQEEKGQKLREEQVVLQTAHNQYGSV